MAPDPIVTSARNPIVQEILEWQGKSKARARDRAIVIEGCREIGLAASAGVVFRKVVYQPQIITAEQVRELVGASAGAATEFIAVSAAVFSRISYRESTGGAIVVAEMPEKGLQALTVRDDAIYIVLESVEKPGNLGAICRVADAAQVAGVIVCDPRTDIYNPNAVRASLGCVFTVDVVSTDSETAMKWLKENRITSFAAELQASEFYRHADLRGSVALIFGTEATGLTPQWIEGADRRVKIPMRGVIDSLNVTTSVAILVFEAMRQRGF